MPLKTDDLKTVETYKKAMKVDATKIGSSGNTKFWVYKDVELPTASGGKQKLPAFLALVDDTAVKQVMKGKPPFCRGVCGLKDGKISFDPTQGKVPYALLTKSVPLLLGKMVHIPSDSDADSEGEEEAPEIKAPEIKGRYAKLNASWKQLSQKANDRISANPTMRAALTKAMTGIPEMLQGGKLGEAEKQIQQLEAALKIPDAPPPPPPGGQGRYAQLNASWKQFSQLAAQKIAEDPAQKAELTKAMARIPEMLQGGQLGEAQKRLEQLGAILKVPATPPPAPPPPSGDATAPGSAAAPGRYAQLNASWKQLSQQAAERIAANPTMRAALTKAMTGIPEMLQGGKLGEAEKQIQQLEAALKIPDAPPPPPPPPGGPGRYAQLNASWKKLSQLAAQKIGEDPEQKAELTKAMAGIPEMLQGGQLGEAQKRLEQLGAILKVPATPPPAPPPPPGGQSTARYAKLNDTWKQLSQEAAEKIAANPEMRAALTKAMTGIPEMLQGGKLGEAEKQLQQLEAALKIPPPPPPPPPPGNRPPAGNRAAQLNATWKQLSQQATQRMTANPAQREYLTKATAGIAQLLESGNLAEVQKRIDRLQEALKLAPNALPPEAEAQTAAWKKLEVRVKQALDKHPEHKAELGRATAGLAEMIRVGKTQLAGQLMATVTAVLKRIQKEEEAALPIEQRTARLTKVWKTVAGDMQRTIARYPDMREELAPVGAAVDRAIQAGKLDEADKRIDQVAGIIEGLGDAQLRYENEYAKVEDLIATHAKGDSEEANKIRLARGVMQDRVDAGDFDAAMQMMERVMALIPGDSNEG